MLKRPWLNYIFISSVLVWQFQIALTPTQAQIPPAPQGQIAYIATDGNMWVVRQGETVPLPITSDASEQVSYLSPRWSPDGSLLVFCRQVQSEVTASSLYFARTGEWEPFPLAEEVFCNDWFEGSFSWSPDGRQIVYARSYEFNPESAASQWQTYYGLWVVDLISGESSELLPPLGANPLVYPQWSANGKWIKFYELAYIEGLGVLHTWEVETGRVVSWVGLGADIFPGTSSWGPDGNVVAFDLVSYTGFPGAGIYLANPDGTDAGRIYAKSSAVATLPLLSPRGDWLAFLLSPYDRPATQLILTTRDGENRVEIANSDSRLAPLDWSPDGAWLLYATHNGEVNDLIAYNVDTGEHAILAQTNTFQADWGPYSEGSTTREALAPQTISDFPFRPGLLLYLAPDYRLVLRDPARELDADLSPPMTVGAFQTSPSHQSVVYRDRWTWVDFATGDELIVQGILLPSAPGEGDISWAPNENRLVMQDAEGRAWLVDRSGSYVEIPGAASTPKWSFDGQWLSYCSGEGALWVIGPNVPPREVAKQVECPARWSPRSYVLAYTTLSSAGTSQANVYDALSDSSSLISEGASFAGWSPDGRLLGLIRADELPGRQIVFALEPDSGKQLLIGRFAESEFGLKDWLPQIGGYQFGPFRIAPDLSSATRVADMLFDVTNRGGRMLVGIGTSNLITITCLEPDMTRSQRVLTANLTGYQGDDFPGVWGDLSGDGEWAAAYAFDRGRYQGILSRCDGTAQIYLQEPEGNAPGEFSPNSRWFFERQTASGAETLMLHDLDQGITQTVSTADHNLAFWLDGVRNVPPGGYVISGRVTGRFGRGLEGVTLLVDGVPAGISAADGRFTISGLPTGEYSLSPQLEGFEFDPSDELVQFPSEEPETFEFSASQIEEDEQEFEPAVLPETSEEIPASPLTRSGPDFLTILILTCVGALFLFVILPVVLIIRRRRKKRRLEDTQPVRTGRILPAQGATSHATVVKSPHTTPEPTQEPVQVSEAEQVSEWLQDGIQLVRKGQLERGAALLHMVVERESNNGTAWMWLGWAAAKSGDRRLAKRCFQHARRLGHPRASQALTWLRKTG